MTIFVPNGGELEMLKNILLSQAMVLGLFKNVVAPDGSLTMAGLQEMPTGGGRGYAPIALSNNLVEDAAAADKWYVAGNAAGKAQGQYSNAPQAWTFMAPDVADGNTVYGVFGYTWILPFKTGRGEGADIKIGDTITGAGGATGVVTAIVVEFGSWAGGDAAGYLCIKTKTGAFVNSEALSIAGPTQVANADTGTSNGGDALKKLLFVDVLPAGYPIDQVGKHIQYPPMLTLAGA